MPTTESHLSIPARFRGPNRSGNGGWTAGALAERAAQHPDRPVDCPVVEVTLRRPPPLEVAMAVTHLDDGTTQLLLDGEPVAVARCSGEEIDPVEDVAPPRAEEAMASYPGHRVHPFPGCFACGTGRAEGDGLRIFPGAVGEGRVASVWVPHESLVEVSDLLNPGVQRVGVATTWAALDCVGGWSSDLEGRPMVLGRMAARVEALPVVGEPHVAVGAELGGEGRKVFTASTLYDSDGRVVARARHTWIAVDPAAFT